MLELNVGQKNISHLVGQQTHIISPEIKKLHKSFTQREVEIKTMKQEVANSAAGMNGISDALSRQNYTIVIQNVEHLLETSLTECQHAIEQLLNVIRTSRKEFFHQSLLTNKQMWTIAREAQDHLSELEFPLALPSMNLLDLTKISVVSIRVQEWKLITA